MFLFENLTWFHGLMFVGVTAALIVLNEISRRSKYSAMFFFIVLPIILTIFVWPKTAIGSSTGTWFHFVKVYSALAGCIGFMALRYIKKLEHNKWMLCFPAIILAINIMEAVVRDFEVSGMMNNEHFMDGGIWNIMNGIAGILNILAISGWLGIRISRDKCRDMIWIDQLWFWIIAYDLWNFAYVYNCVSDHAFYAGAALLISCTLPAFFLKKGAWLQHRAHTLAFWMMFTMCFPIFTDSATIGVHASRSETPYIVVSALALLANLAVFIFHIYKIVHNKRNPFKDEVYADLKAYKEIASEYELSTKK